MAALTTVQDLRDQALLKANDTRVNRAKTLNRMYALTPAESHRLAATLIENPPAELESLRVGRFLTAVRQNRRPGHGRPRRSSQYTAGALRLMRLASCTDLTRMRDLSVRQRLVLAECLRLRAEECES